MCKKDGRAVFTADSEWDAIIFAIKEVIGEAGEHESVVLVRDAGLQLTVKWAV